MGAILGVAQSPKIQSILPPELLLGGSGNLFMPKAGHFVVVYHSDGLHESVRHGRADKFKTFFLTFCGLVLQVNFGERTT
jgi:hypothetical protein